MSIQQLMLAQSISSSLPSIPTGMNVWFSADYITYSGGIGGTPADGTAITAWADRSGNGNNLSKTTGTATFHTSQLNGMPAVTLSSCTLQLGSGIGPGSGIWTVFAVQKLGSTGNSTILGNTSAGSCLTYSITTAQSVFGAGGGTVLGTSAADTSWHQINVLFKNNLSGNSYAFRRDRASDGSGSPGFNIVGANETIGSNGGGFFYAGQIAELIYYNTGLTSPEMTQVEAYFLAKYGI